MDVNSSRACSFCIALDFKFGQSFANQQRRFEDLIEACSRSRIQIEVELIGPVHVVTSGVPRVQVDATEVDSP